MSSLCFQNLEAFIRGKVQPWYQDLLEAEVQEVINRDRYARREPASPPVDRNGHGKPRRVTFASGTVTVWRPRLRNLTERFESRLLMLAERRFRILGSPELLKDLFDGGVYQDGKKGTKTQDLANSRLHTV